MKYKIKIEVKRSVDKATPIETKFLHGTLTIDETNMDAHDRAEALFATEFAANNHVSQIIGNCSYRMHIIEGNS